MKRITWLILTALLFTSLAHGQDVGALGKQKPFAISGTLGVGLGTYRVSGIDPRQREFSYLFNGAPMVSIYGVSFPFMVVVSDQQRGFRQPFNQYGISPTYKWVTVHAGWQNVQFSQFTLAGYNILGGGVELNPGKLRFGFIYGRFNKAIEETAAQPLSFQTPAYKRTGYSVKLGYGTERNHFDVVMLNARDHAGSLSFAPTDLKPADNLVVGIVSRWTFFKKIVWDIDMAGSIYTRNKLEDTVKNLKLGQLDIVRRFVAINASSQLLGAGQTSLNYQGRNFNIGVQYRRVDPDYKSMGAYYFESDVQNYTAQGSVSLVKNQLQLTGSLGFQNDNLLNDKAYTSRRNISSFGLAFNKAKYGIDVRYSNYGITQDRGLNPIIDTFRVARTNYNINTLLRYSLGETLTHSFVLVGTLQSLVDLNRYTADQNKSKSKTGNLTYQLGLTGIGVNINTNYNYTVADMSLFNTRIYGPSLGVDKQFLKGKGSLNATFSWQQQKNDNIDAGSIFSGTLNGNYRINKRAGAGLTVSYLKSNSKDVTLPSFNELRTALNLTHTF